jgi:hypothetical protein
MQSSEGTEEGKQRCGPNSPEGRTPGVVWAQGMVCLQRGTGQQVQQLTIQGEMEVGDGLHGRDNRNTKENKANDKYIKANTKGCFLKNPGYWTRNETVETYDFIIYTHRYSNIYI